MSRPSKHTTTSTAYNTSNNNDDDTLSNAVMYLDTNDHGDVDFDRVCSPWGHWVVVLLFLSLYWLSLRNPTVCCQLTEGRL